MVIRMQSSGLCRKKGDMAYFNRLQFEIRISDDTAKLDPELICTKCDMILCGVEHMDTLSCLVSVAEDHATHGCQKLHNDEGAQ
jgi:hypothetical protein